MKFWVEGVSKVHEKINQNKDPEPECRRLHPRFYFSLPETIRPHLTRGGVITLPYVTSILFSSHLLKFTRHRVS